ncbi:MAG: hypothetical protein KGN36_08245 [Acidobacteriota bacterium]|nr:hypothetical protein [Acidobacteriota bacterium]
MRGGGDWATAGNDAQRSGWVRSDQKISPVGMARPGFAFLWKQKLAGDPKQLNSLTEAVLLDRYIGYRGFRSLAQVGASGNRIVALDTDLGRVEWEKALGAAAAQAGTMACPGGLTTPLARPVGTEFPAAGAGGGGGFGGRGGPAKSAVGEAGQGSVQLAQAAENERAMAARFAAMAGRGPGGRGGFQRMPSFVYALSSDGKLHIMYVSNGEESHPAIPFLPPNANALGLTVTGNVAYAATTNNCGGVPNGVWALDLESKKVTSWKAPGAIAGSLGFAFAPDGTLYAATETGTLAALEPKTLKVLASYNPGAPGFASTPLVFEHANKPMVAVAAKDGSVHILPATLDSAAARTPAATSTGTVAAGALATWQDKQGTRWILAPSANAVVAWKLVDQGGTLALERGWASRDMTSPMPPMVVNGVVFAVASGEFRSAGASAAQVAQKSAKAVLYALDGETGKELWNSGNTITSFAHSGGLSAGASQVYLETYDGTLYAFGFPIEH